jgi:hypothetical protein
MSDTILFIWGVSAFLLAVGPLSVAVYLDMKDDHDHNS